MYGLRMAETGNIAEMAKRITDDIFGIFGWERRGALDENWACSKDHKPKPTEANESSSDMAAEPKTTKTHPSDIVFRYDDPYSDAATYLTTDLKSYAGNSITKSSIGKALRSLCYAVDCANVGEFQDRYVSGDERWHAHGLLFVYNHAGDYDRNKFTSLIRDATPANLRAPKNGRVFVLGPDEIAHLHAVARDLKVHRGEHAGAEFSWFTPDLINRKSRSPSFGQAAPIEMLLGPWQIAGVKLPGQPNPSLLRLYYRCRDTATIEEFEFLIEFLFRHRLLDHQIDLCFVGAAAEPVLEKYNLAVNNIVRGLYDLPEFRQRLDKVKPNVLSEFETRFSQRNIGMERS